MNYVLLIKYVVCYIGGLWVGKFLWIVIYQEVIFFEVSGELGCLCGRVVRVEFFEGYVRFGDVWVYLYLKDKFDWIKF